MTTLVPDVIDRPSSAFLGGLEAKIAAGAASPSVLSLSLDPSVTDVEMRLTQVIISDARERGGAEVVLVTVMGDDSGDPPGLTKLQAFEGVKDNKALDLGPEGLTLYRNPKQGQVPRFLDFRIALIETDEDVRAIGNLVEEIEKNEDWQKLRDGIIALTAIAAPTAALVTAGVDLAMHIAAHFLKANQDDQLIQVAGSYNDKLDDLGVHRGLVFQSTKYATIAYQVRAG